MTREEAVKMLNRLLLYCECPHGDCEKCVDAIDMAIEALQHEPSEDCISRPEEGLTVLIFTEGGNKIIEHLEQMPSAKPKTGEETEQ